MVLWFNQMCFWNSILVVVDVGLDMIGAIETYKHETALR